MISDTKLTSVKIITELYKKFKVVALNAENGIPLWEIKSEFPLGFRGMVVEYDKKLNRIPMREIFVNTTSIQDAFKGADTIDEAIKNLKKAIQINPNLSEAHYNLGNALAETEQYNESIISYNPGFFFYLIFQLRYSPS